MKYIFTLLFTLTLPAIAEAPQCDMQNRGIVHCFADRLCVCDYQRSGIMTNDPGGYRWDCSINRPPCIDPNKIEESKPYEGPEAVSIDESDNSVVIENAPANTNTNN